MNTNRLRLGRWEWVCLVFFASRRIFRHDTFGDEAFWGGTLQLHRAIEGERFGGVGPGVSPATALSVGLKVDAEALPEETIDAIKEGRVNLNDPAVTLALLDRNAVVGVTAHRGSDGGLATVGINCAFCHSTVDNSVAFGIGRRLDGWPNRDLNVGAIVALAPDLQAIADLLQTDQQTVRPVLGSWGPGRFDAELILDGKAFRPDGRTSATLLPAAFGLAGVNLHTYTGWGSVPHWNGLVANLEMHGQGTFVDARLNDSVRFPVAARASLDGTCTPPPRSASMTFSRAGRLTESTGRRRWPVSSPVRKAASIMTVVSPTFAPSSITTTRCSA